MYVRLAAYFERKKNLVVLKNKVKKELNILILNLQYFNFQIKRKLNPNKTENKPKIKIRLEINPKKIEPKINIK